ncbi:MAG: D-alanine--D-alanine ligase [Thermoanaerobaculaceae bacterium]|nr:D-alanine--D-alanine ligase [Thermoanaerobaculaceae bacterium]
MKKKIGILFGGKSGEHEVSIQSALNIFEALDRDKYVPFLIGVDKEGNFRFLSGSSHIVNRDDPKRIAISDEAPIVQPIKGENSTLCFFYNESGSFVEEVDFVFPIIHGNSGEDGCLQGFLKWLEVPFAGASILGSSIGMDKDVAKRLLKEAGVEVCKFFAFSKGECERGEYLKFVDKLGYPIFVKPASTGSSLGISKVKNQQELQRAVERALSFDKKVILEEAVIGRELECAVLGNDEVLASCLGEIIPKHEFYSYDAKYVDPDGAELIAPAELPAEIEEKMKEIAVKTFKVLECEGMARVDFFLTKDGKIFVNEINTLPGFTKISMYPRLWQISGISYNELLDKLIELGFQRYENEKKLKTTAEF